MLQTYDINLEGRDGEQTEVKLRLTLGGQIALKKKHNNQPTFATITEALDDAETYAEIMKEALNYKGNGNTIKDGAELYDLLVDNGYAGYEGLGSVLLSVAVVSGIISEAVKEKTLNAIIGAFDNVIDGAEPAPTADNEKNA